MASASFARLATVTASTKRATLSSGKRAAPAAYLTGVSCLPLDPVDQALQQRLQLDTPHEVLQTFVDAGLDILAGDILVVSSTEYPIKWVGEWTFGSSEYLHLVVEDLKR
jgi:hypothetical protein